MNAKTSSLMGPKPRKTLLQLLIGMVGGAGLMILTLHLLDNHGDFSREPSHALGLGTAVVYALMALFVGLGTLAPGIGARTLNVEDAEELQEQRPQLLVGSAYFLLVAVLLGSLSLVTADSGEGLLSPRTGLIVTLAASAGIIALGVRYRTLGDEMTRKLNYESGLWALALVVLTFGAIAVGAQLGLAPMFEPLTFVAGVFALHLLAVFIVVGRHGMLKPR